MSARLVVIIATLGRKDVVTRLLERLEHQIRRPDAVIISSPTIEHVPDYVPSYPLVKTLGRNGLTAQRNHALEYALPLFDVIVFLDDDLIPAADYLERTGRAFEENPQWAVVTGNIVKDGVNTGGLTWKEGVQAINQIDASPVPDLEAIDQIGAQGATMSVRTSMVGDLRFDERLVLYGWQEDIDFSSQLRQRGRVVRLPSIRGVHLGARGGRVSGLRFGYSQVANPIYLIRKGSVPARFALRLMARNVTANIVRSFWPEAHVDRRGRLLGNLMAFAHAVRGRVEPEYILKI